MYARVIRFVLGPDTEWEADRMADAISLLVKQQRGFKGMQFFHDYQNGEYQWVTLWETQQDWEASYQNVIDAKRAMIGDKFQWQIAVQMYHVYEPKPQDEC